MNTPTLSPPELLHIERDGAEVYVTTSNGLERVCTMSRPGEQERLADARMIVRAVNARALMVEALQCMIEHAKERFPHFESERGQKDIADAQKAVESGNYDYNL